MASVTRTVTYIQQPSVTFLAVRARSTKLRMFTRSLLKAPIITCWSHFPRTPNKCSTQSTWVKTCSYSQSSSMRSEDSRCARNQRQRLLLKCLSSPTVCCRSYRWRRTLRLQGRLVMWKNSIRSRDRIYLGPWRRRSWHPVHRNLDAIRLGLP